MKDQDNNEKTIIVLFEEQVLKTPKNIALVSDQETLSYETLNVKANQLAHYLHEQGVGPEKLVAIHLDRSVQAIVVILAILKAGGAYLPLDLNDPLLRLKFILEDSCCDFLIVPSSNELSENSDINKVSLIILNEITEILTQQSDINLPIVANLRNLAYVIYTSGSTGQPKGVEILHKGLPNFAKAQISEFNATEQSRVLQFSVLHFDASVFELWFTLLSGAALYIPFYHLRCDPICLLDYLHKHKISIAAIPPTILTKMPCRSYPELKVLIPIADTCPQKTLDAWRSDCLVINAYGPTEITVCATMAVYDGEHPQCIGKALPNVQCYVLNGNLQELKIGEVGELYIAGIGLARGYRNQLDLTCQSFIDWQADKNTKPIRIYKTGDRVKQMPDGRLDYIGRMDFQIKFHGVRIDPAEIEIRLNEHVLVEHSVVALKKENDRQYLVAYIVPKKNQTLESHQLRTYLENYLPNNKIPNAFVFLKTLPLTRTNKIDRDKLPMPSFQELSQELRVFTREESELSLLWADILKINEKSIEPNSDFFALGGSSLLATQLALKLSQKWYCDITSIDIFEHPLLKEQVGLPHTSIRQTTLSIIQRSPSKTLPLSFAERRLWLAYQMLKDRRPQTYNVNLKLKFDGDLNAAVLQRALQSMVGRHEILRTYFPEMNVQAIAEYSFVLEQRTLNLITSDPEQALKKVLDTFCQCDFGDLKKLPLMRGLLIQTNSDQHVLCLVFHHIIIDGMSLPLFIEELQIFYNAYLKKQDPKLSPLPLQYADFVLWEKQCLLKGHYNEAFEYWKRQLAGVSNLLELPFDYSDYPTFEGASLIFYFSKSMMDSLKALAEQQGVPLFTLLFASIAILLYRYNQEEDMILGVAYGKRPHPDLKRLIGFFVNMLPIRIQQNNQKSFLDVLTQIQATLFQAYKHSAPLEEIIDQLELPHHMNCHPLFQVSVTMHDGSELDLNFSDVSTSLLEPSLITASDLNSAKCDLGFEMECLVDGRLAIKMEYAKDLFALETIERMGKQWLRLCESLLKTPDHPIDTLSLLNEKEKQHILSEWSKPIVDQSPKDTIVSLFERVMQQNPNAIAIIDGEKQWTYNKLNEEANRLAHHLLKIQPSLKPDTRIAIVLYRSAEFIVSVLAVLKAGAAYLPLDPEFPKQRLQFMLEDAEAAYIITDQFSAKNIPETEINRFYWDDIQQTLREEMSTNPNVAIMPQHLAYVIYTSGSTGKPKGVMIEHRNVVALVKNITYMKLTEEDRVAHVCNVTFDVSVFEIFATLLYGARLIVIPKSILLNPPLFKKTLVEQGVSITVLPTAIFYRLLISDIGIFRSVNYVLFIGEKLMSTKILIELFNLPEQSPKHLINIYGPTEDTVFSICGEIKKESVEISDELSIGTPIKGSLAYVLDRSLQPVPLETLGELYLGGMKLARGYLNRPDLTEKQFIVNPFQEGGRLYRTGDLVRYQANGELVFIRRTDQQVKISGYRVELEEIGKLLLLLPTIQEAVVLNKNVDGFPMLVAYVVTIKQENTEEPEQIKQELRENLSEILPHYMLPSAFVLMDALPLNTNNKIDRDKLLSVNFEIKHEYIPPTTATEKHLLALWRSILPFRKKIGIQDNFFMIGGSSLLAMQLAAMVHKKFGPISYSDLFRQPTIQSQSQLIGTPENQRITPTKNIEYFKQEAILDESIRLSTAWKEQQYPIHPKSIFLTGATGFLGVFLLEELLKTTDAIIFCLIRARDQKHAASRFKETLRKYRLKIPAHSISRIYWVIGNIEMPRLGLSEKEYDELASRVDLIYHSASAVNFAKPYSALKSVNVEGVKHVLRFAISQTIKPLHYISSASVFSFAHYFKKRAVLFEQEVKWDEAYAQALPHDLGYAQSKAVSEKLVCQAKERGIPIIIHRSGFILCHSQTGAGSVEQLWAMFIKDCLPLGSFPQFCDLKGEFITVDYASRAIVQISRRAECVNKIFHIVPTPEHNVTTDDLFFFAEKLGSPLKPELLSVWHENLQEYIDRGNSSTLALLMPLFTDRVADSLTLFEAYQYSPNYSVENTQQFLQGSGIRNFPIDADILSRYVTYLSEEDPLWICQMARQDSLQANLLQPNFSID